MSGGSEQTTESTVVNTPWAPAANLIEQMLPTIGGAMGQPLQYTGPSYVPWSPMQQQAFNQLGQYAGQAGQQVVDPAMQAWRQQLDPSSFLTAPGASAPLDWYATQVGRNLEENVRPGYGVEGMAAGQYGGYSSQRAKNERLAERQAQEAIGQFGQQLTGQLYNQGLQAQAGALGMAPGMMQLGAAPAQMQFDLGGLQRGETQQQQALANARRQFEQTEPYQRAQMAAGLLYPAAGLGGTQMGTQTTETDTGLMGALMPALSMGLGAFGAGGPFAGLLGGMGGGVPMMGVGGMSTMPGAYGGGYTPFMWQGGRKYY